MTKTRISKIFAKDILGEKSECIKDGYINFDRIDISQYPPGPTKIEFYLKGDFLMSIKAEGNLSPYSIFTLHLAEGNMKMEFVDEDICEELEQSLQSQINEIWDVIRRL